MTPSTRPSTRPRIVFRVVCGWVWLELEAAWNSGGGGGVRSWFFTVASCAASVAFCAAVSCAGDADGLYVCGFSSWSIVMNFLLACWMFW
jgi:hypothetical protein